MADPRRFVVSISPAQREKLAEVREWAESNGMLSDFALAMREITFRLTVEPHEWGESREYLPFMRVQLRCGVSHMVAVLYGVVEARDIVLVKEFRINRNYKPGPSA